jgi:hypothetical protein
MNPRLKFLRITNPLGFSAIDNNITILYTYLGFPLGYQICSIMVMEYLALKKAGKVFIIGYPFNPGIPIP